MITAIEANHRCHALCIRGTVEGRADDGAGESRGRRWEAIVLLDIVNVAVDVVVVVAVDTGNDHVRRRG